MFVQYIDKVKGAYLLTALSKCSLINGNSMTATFTYMRAEVPRKKKVQFTELRKIFTVRTGLIKD